MNERHPDLPRFDTVTTVTRSLGLVGGILLLVGAFAARDHFFLSYLTAYLYCAGIALGCLGILLLHQITGGAWGDVIRPTLTTAAQTIPWLGVLFLPLAFGMKALFPWARPEVVAADALLQHKQAFLNIPFFWIRALVYFGAWSFMARLAARPRHEASASPDWAPAAMVFYFLTVTFAAIDWMMSLEPHWYSTLFPVMVMIGWGLVGYAFCIVVVRWMEPGRVSDPPVEPKPYHDLGNLLLAFTMFWAYTSFSQYLIIWSADLPEEVTWYLSRQKGGWFWTAMVLVVFQFFLPFLILLVRRNKQRLDRLASVAAWLLGFQAVNVFWLIQPPFHPRGFHVHWLDLAAMAAMGGAWTSLFFKLYRRRILQ